MASFWKEIEQAAEDKRCELILTGNSISERISQDGLDYKLFKLQHLNFLEISKTCLDILPSEIGELINLTRVIICNNELKSLPTSISNLKKLKFLDISRNQITQLPPEINSLSELQSLNANSNLLESLPPLNQLVKLVTLNIGNNKFYKFPCNICNKELIYFTELIANNNNLSEIPPDIENLTNLKILDLGGNALSTIPGELGNCTKLKELNLKGNKLKDKRLMKLVDQCHLKQVMDYIRNHCTKTDEETAQKSKKKIKHNKKATENVKILEVLDQIKVLHVSDETIKVVSSTNVSDIRPYIICCIACDVNLSEDNRFKKFITLQTKLHDSICEKRTVATIATHDLAKIQRNLLYDARLPQEIKITPLNRKKLQTAAELYAQLNEEADALRKEKKKNTFSPIHKYIYLLKDKPLYPCLLDSSGQVISFPPITNSDVTKISENTTHILLEVTGNDLNKCKKVMDTMLIEMLKLGIGNKKNESDEESQKAEQNFLTVEQVQIVDHEGQLKAVYPSRSDIHTENINVIRA